MDYSFLDKDEYKEIPVIKITVNNNDLPFYIICMDKCNEHPHRHEFVQIIYMSRGKLKHVINDNVFEVVKGDIFVIPPYVPHYFIDDSKEKFELIEFEFVPEFINEKFSSDCMDSSFMDFAYLEPFLVAQNAIKPRLNLKGSLMNEVEDILREIIREYEIKDRDFSLLIKALSQKLLVIVGREFRKNVEHSETSSLFERHRDALHSALVYIEDNLDKTITLDDAAKTAMISQSYFRYLFRLMTQKSFTEYVNEQRINKACRLLKIKPHMKVSDICTRVGYNNISHFNRIFRQVTGQTPVMVRKSKY